MIIFLGQGAPTKKYSLIWVITLYSSLAIWNRTFGFVHKVFQIPPSCDPSNYRLISIIHPTYCYILQIAEHLFKCPTNRRLKCFSGWAAQLMCCCLMLVCLNPRTPRLFRGPRSILHSVELIQLRPELPAFSNNSLWCECWSCWKSFFCSRVGSEALCNVTLFVGQSSTLFQTEISQL